MSKAKRRDLSQRDLDEISQALLLEIANDHPEDIDLVLEWLRNVAGDPKAIARLARYNHEPVSPEEFIKNPAFMGNPEAMWPEVFRCFCELNSGKYVESVLTGAIGAGKTHLALYTQAYQLYLISCLRDPHSEFDLDASSEILIVFQSKTEKLAKGVDYERFRSMISKSPYFQKHFPFDQGYLSEMRFPNRIIVKPISGEDTGAIGQNVIGGLIDEINFMAVTEKSKMAHDNGVYDQAIKNYNSIARRRESRFMNKGELPGMLCLVSSRNYPGQFTDKKEAEAKTNPRIYVYDKRRWDVTPWQFGEDRFKVFIGDETRKPFIVKPGMSVHPKDEHLVHDIPVEYRLQFENDLLNALRDIAGVATMSLHPFMLDTEKVTSCFGKVPSIASREDADFVETKLKLFPKKISMPQVPRLVHIDLAYAKDSAGVSCGYVPGFTKMVRGDHFEMLPRVRFDFILEVKVPRGGEIEFENIRRLLYTLRDKVGLPIKWVTFDGFQSRDSMQMLTQKGFVVDYTSMDKDTMAYDFTKQAFYDGRIEAPEHPKAQKEMITLEIDTKKKVIDHPPHGSKDVADSMAGVVSGLTLLRETWLTHGVPLVSAPSIVNKVRDMGTATKVKQGDNVDFEGMVDE